MSEQNFKQVELYPHSVQYAREHGELDTYRASYRANLACKDAITEAIRENYHDNHLDISVASPQLGESFSEDRIAYVLAVTVQHKDWDGRISQENKSWAKTVPVCEDLDAWQQDRSIHFVVDQAHPGLVDLFVTQFRKGLEQDRVPPDKRPSVLAKLKENTAFTNEVMVPSKHAKEATR